MSTPLIVAAHSDSGRQHDRNEDSWATEALPDGARLLLVCDGMGGMGRGDEASRLAVRTIVEFVRDNALPPRSRLESAIDLADRTIRQTLCTGEEKPGSTVVAALVIANLVYVAWVGDSRAYWVRGAEILARTTDHKLVQDLVDAGELTAVEARRSTLSSVLSHSLGGRPPDADAVQVSLMPAPWRLEPGDRLLLCSDGVVDLVTDDEIPQILENVHAERAARDFVDLANIRGGHDNSTAIVAVWDDGTVEYAGRELGSPLQSFAPTEGFAPTRDHAPSDWDDDDEDDKATVLGGPAHEMLMAELLPPTPEPASTRDAAPAPPTPLPPPPPQPPRSDEESLSVPMLVGTVVLVVVAVGAIAYMVASVLS